MKKLYLNIAFVVFVFSVSAFAQNTDARRYFDVGMTYLKGGNYNQAIESFRQAIALEDDYAEAYAEMGVSYELKGDYNQAVQYLEKAISLMGNASEPIYLADAFNGLGEIYIKRGDSVLAKRYVGQAISINPNSSQAYNNLGLICLAQGSLDQAIANFSRAVNLSSFSLNKGEYYFNLALAYQKNGDTVKAKQSFQDALKSTFDMTKKLEIQRKLKELGIE